MHERVVARKLRITSAFFFESRALPPFREEDALEFYVSLMVNHLWHSSAAESEIVLERRSEARGSLLAYANSRLYGLSLDVFPARAALEQLRPASIVTLVNALLLEKKLILVKEDVGDLALLVEGLLSFIRPFQWHFTCISYLTRDLLDAVESPFPFIMGVSRKLWSAAFAANVDEISYD